MGPSETQSSLTWTKMSNNLRNMKLRKYFLIGGLTFISVISLLYTSLQDSQIEEVDPAQLNADTDSSFELAPPENTTLKCPRWIPFNTKAQARKNFSGNCRIIQSIPMFEVTLCESMRECGQGYFIIERKNKVQCQAAMARSIAWDPEYEKWLKETIGPDAFTVTFSGPQRLAPSDWVHLGNCTYKHPYRLTNPGQYTVNIIHTHQDFEAVQERSRTVTMVVNQDLIRNFEMDVCSEHCTGFTAKYVEEKLWPKLPLCDRYAPTQGVYLGSGDKVEGGMLEREKYKFEKFKVPYFWMPLGCRYDQLFELGQNAECHARNKSVKFLGDSQVRVQWDVIDRRVVGTKELLAHNVHEGSRVNHYVLEKARNVYWEDRKEMPSPEEGEVRTTFDFAGRDGHLHWFSKEYMDNPEYEREGNPQSEAETNGLDRHMKKFDAMVFNVGMWPMSGIRDGGHFTTGRFKALIQWSAENMMEMNYRRGTVKKDPLVMVWHGLASYPVPAHISEDDKKRKDWRSPYRLKIWSDIAEEVLSKYHGMRRLNAHDLTQPFIYDTPDGGHYFKTPAVEAETDELLHKLNLCDANY